MVLNASSWLRGRSLAIGIAALLAALLPTFGCAKIIDSRNGLATTGERIDRELTRETVEEKFSTAALRLTELENGAIVSAGTKTQEIPILELLENQYAVSPFSSVILNSQALSLPEVNDRGMLAQWCVEKNVNLIVREPHGRFDAPEFEWKVARTWGQ